MGQSEIFPFLFFFIFYFFIFSCLQLRASSNFLFFLFFFNVLVSSSEYTIVQDNTKQIKKNGLKTTVDREQNQ